MSRFELIVLLLVMGCAYSVVTARYSARMLYDQRAQNQALIHQLDAEYTRLQLEDSTHNSHLTLLRQLAQHRLGLVSPHQHRILIVSNG